MCVSVACGVLCCCVCMAVYAYGWWFSVVCECVCVCACVCVCTINSGHAQRVNFIAIMGDKQSGLINRDVVLHLTESWGGDQISL